MKKLLTIALFLIPFLGFAQTTKPIDGFLGIKFGSSKADVIAALKAKGGTLIDGGSADIIYFKNINLGHRASKSLQVNFLDDKAYFAGFVFQPENDPQTFDFYNGLVTDISDIYGKGTSVRDFKSPYKDGDGDEVTAIQSGYATIITGWEAEKKIIKLYISNKLKVILTYQDNVMMIEAEARKKAKEKSDF